MHPWRRIRSWFVLLLNGVGCGDVATKRRRRVTVAAMCDKPWVWTSTVESGAAARRSRKPELVARSRQRETLECFEADGMDDRTTGRGAEMGGRAGQGRQVEDDRDGLRLAGRRDGSGGHYRAELDVSQSCRARQWAGRIMRWGWKQRVLNRWW